MDPAFRQANAAWYRLQIRVRKEGEWVNVDVWMCRDAMMGVVGQKVSEFGIRYDRGG
jgi:hypothetical protein